MPRVKSRWLSDATGARVKGGGDGSPVNPSRASRRMRMRDDERWRDELEEFLPSVILC